LGASSCGFRFASSWFCGVFKTASAGMEQPDWLLG
jgi:hypothetical protein